MEEDKMEKNITWEIIYFLLLFVSQILILFLAFGFPEYSFGRLFDFLGIFKAATVYSTCAVIICIGFAKMCMRIDHELYKNGYRTAL